MPPPQISEQRTTGGSVLLICTANHCRSPMAEFFFRARIDLLELPWTVSSAGTRAVTGTPMHPYCREILERRGITVNGWGARKITADLLAGASVILTATEDHALEITRAHQHVADRTFTLNRFGYLASRSAGEMSPGENGPLDVLADVRKSMTQRQPMTESPNIPDPMGKRMRAFRECAALIDHAVDRIAGAQDLPRGPGV